MMTSRQLDSQRRMNAKAATQTSKPSTTGEETGMEAPSQQATTVSTPSASKNNAQAYTQVLQDYLYSLTRQQMDRRFEGYKEWRF